MLDPNPDPDPKPEPELHTVPGPLRQKVAGPVPVPQQCVPALVINGKWSRWLTSFTKIHATIQANNC
jgi:hypothetical protein